MRKCRHRDGDLQWNSEGRPGHATVAPLVLLTPDSTVSSVARGNAQHWGLIKYPLQKYHNQQRSFMQSWYEQNSCLNYLVTKDATFCRHFLRSLSALLVCWDVSCVVSPLFCLCIFFEEFPKFTISTSVCCLPSLGFYPPALSECWYYCWILFLFNF